MPELNMAQSINDAMAIALETDDRVIVFGEDVGATGGVFRVSDGLQAAHGTERVIDAPVADRIRTSEVPRWEKLKCDCPSRHQARRFHSDTASH